MLKNGVCCLGNDLYSKSLVFADINYQIAKQEQKEDIFSRYMEILNSLGSEHGVQLTVNNRRLDVEDFESRVLFSMQGDGLDEYRQEYNRMLLEKIEEGNNNIISEKMITFTTKAENVEEATKVLDILSREYENKFRELGCECRIMKGIERLDTLHSIFNPEGKFSFRYEDLDNQMYFTTKDAIAPDVLDFKADTSSFKINERHAKVMYLKNYSTELSDQLIQNLTKLEHNLSVSFHMKAIPRGEDVSLVKNQIAKMEMQIMDEQKKLIRQGNDPEMYSSELKYSYSEAKELRSNIQERNQRLFQCQLVIMLNANSSNELNQMEKEVQTVCKGMTTELGVLSYQQENGLNACLPIGKPIPTLSRTLTTSVCGVIMPFTSQELMQYTGNYIGQNAITNNVIMCDRNVLKNSNGFILGSSGSGKSFAVKNEIYNVHAKTDDDIIIIDPEGEYTSLVKALCGSVINIDNRNDVHLNSFEGDIKNKDFIPSKAEFAQTFLAEVIGGGKLTPEQRGLIDRCVRIMYTRYQERLDDGGGAIQIPMPTLRTFYETLLAQPEMVAKDMGLALEMYVNGSYSLFSEQSNVDLNNRLTSFNILELGNSLSTLGMIVIMESLWERVMKNFREGRKTWLYIDEIYLMFRSEYTSNFLYELFKRARKFGGNVTGVTQNVEDLLLNDKARTMLSNSEFIIMMNQSYSDRDELANLLNISDAQLEFVSNAPAGQGLLRNGSNIIPFVNKMDKSLKLYSLLTTNLQEVQMIREGKELK